MFTVPSHHQTDPAKLPGQIVNPVSSSPRPATADRTTLAHYITQVQACELFHSAAHKLVCASMCSMKYEITRLRTWHCVRPEGALGTCGWINGVGWDARFFRTAGAAQRWIDSQSKVAA